MFNKIGFQTVSGAGVAAAVIELEMDIEQRHNHLLELIAARSDIESCDTTSSVIFSQHHALGFANSLIDSAAKKIL